MDAIATTTVDQRIRSFLERQQVFCPFCDVSVSELGDTNAHLQIHILWKHPLRFATYYENVLTKDVEGGVHVDEEEYKDCFDMEDRRVNQWLRNLRANQFNNPIRNDQLHKKDDEEDDIRSDTVSSSSARRHGSADANARRRRQSSGDRSSDNSQPEEMPSSTTHTLSVVPAATATSDQLKEQILELLCKGI